MQNLLTKINQMKLILLQHRCLKKFHLQFPPKPACPNKPNTGCLLTDSAQNLCDNPNKKTTAMVTLNQAPVKPVVQNMINKTSIAEIAKLADSLEIVVNETLHQTQFVSQAKATLSPVPQRKVRDAISAPEDVGDDNDSVIESGIVSESVSASSVIQMFGGIGKFKKVAKDDTVINHLPDPVSSVNGRWIPVLCKLCHVRLIHLCPNERSRQGCRS